MTIKINDTIPNFEVVDDEGNKFTQDNLKGQLTVLYFYPKNDTPGCTNEAVDFNGLLNELVGYGANVIGVSKDSIESHKKFKEKYDLEFTLLSDQTLNMHKAFGAYGTKTSFGKTSEGVIRSTFIIGKDLKILYAEYKVSVKGHAEVILGKIKNLATNV